MVLKPGTLLIIDNTLYSVAKPKPWKSAVLTLLDMNSGEEYYLRHSYLKAYSDSGRLYVVKDTDLVIRALYGA